MEHIRKAEARDASRIAEILVFNNRLNYYPIFQDDEYSFGELQVVPMAKELSEDAALLACHYVYDDGVVRGVIRIEGKEIVKLFVDPCFQGRGVGAALIEYAVRMHGADNLWALEKNVRAIRFYQRHGFVLTDEKTLEEDTTEYLVRMRRKHAEA